MVTVEVREVVAMVTDPNEEPLQPRLASEPDVSQKSGTGVCIEMQDDECV